MKNTKTTNKVVPNTVDTNSIVTLVTQAVLSAIGQGNALPAVSVPFADTQASHNTRETPSALKSKGRGKRRHDDVSITISQSMLDGRMKLPARMFTKGTKVVVDGHTLTQQPHDQNRSTKFDPAIFGYELDAGDVITFTHVDGNKWDVLEVAEGDPAPKRKPTSKKASKPTSKSTASKKSGKASKPVPAKKASKPEPSSKSLALKDFAEFAIENANDDDFEENENIKATGAFDVDARIYLTTAQSRKFRAWWKSKGLTLSSAVKKLNALVFDED